MQLQIQLPGTFPLHGIEHDVFEAKLRDALHYVFDGSRVRQLAEQVDGRQPFDPSDVLPLRRTGDEHAFEQCMTLDRCRFDDMSVTLRRVVMNAIGAHLALELTEPGIATGIVGVAQDATNRQPPDTPPSLRRGRSGFAALAIAADLAVGVPPERQRCGGLPSPRLRRRWRRRLSLHRLRKRCTIWRAACLEAGDRTGSRFRSSRRAQMWDRTARGREAL